MDAPVHGRMTQLRVATAADVERLVAWHADPEVARFWDGEMFTEKEMSARLERPDVEAWIVETEGVPVGYLQVGGDGVAEGGLDMFLVPETRGRGLGPDAARAMADHLLDTRGWPPVTVDPYAWNEQALRGWRKAGFVAVSHHDADEEHTAPWVLMELRR